MSQETSEQIQFSPFQSIALCFSGGGFRAAAFSLGVLSYLNKVKIKSAEGEASLLSHVNFIASASGGTITNLCIVATCSNITTSLKLTSVAIGNCILL